MKIYNKIVLDMATGAVLEENSFEYEGPVALCGGDSGSQSSTTTYNLQPWEYYVPQRTSYYYREALPKLYDRYEKEQGLSPQEKQVYRSRITSDVAGKYAGAERQLEGNLARAGVKGGAASEAYGGLQREKLRTGVTALGKIFDIDQAKKQQNIENLATFLGIPRGPIVGGASTETSGGGGGT